MTSHDEGRTRRPVDDGDARSAEATPTFARGFQLIYPDGFTVDGTQFPSGRCVVDYVAMGLLDAAVSIDALSCRRPGDRIVWADERAQVLAEVDRALRGDRLAEVVALATGQHHINYANNDTCVCGQWSDGGTDEPGWDDHMAEVALRAAADYLRTLTDQPADHSGE